MKMNMTYAVYINVSSSSYYYYYYFFSSWTLNELFPKIMS